MRIGIVGVGPVGRTLGTIWARAATQEEAAAFGKVVLWTARGVMPARPDVLAGEIVVDPNNRGPGPDGSYASRVPTDRASPSSSRRPSRGRAW